MIAALLITRIPRAFVGVSQCSGVRTEDGAACVATLTMAPGNTRRQEVRLGNK